MCVFKTKYQNLYISLPIQITQYHVQITHNMVYKTDSNLLSEKISEISLNIVCLDYTVLCVHNT